MPKAGGGKKTSFVASKACLLPNNARKITQHMTTYINSQLKCAVGQGFVWLALRQTDVKHKSWVTETKRLRYEAS